MSQLHILRGLSLAALFALTGATGCFAASGEGSETGEVDTTEQDVRAAETAPNRPRGEWSVTATGPARQAGGGEAETRPGCNSCGQGVPWTPPPGSLQPGTPGTRPDPEASPAEQDPAK